MSEDQLGIHTEIGRELIRSVCSPLSPSIKNVSKWCRKHGRSRSNVMRRISELEEAGYLHVERSDLCLTIHPTPLAYAVYYALDLLDTDIEDTEAIASKITHYMEALSERIRGS